MKKVLFILVGLLFLSVGSASAFTIWPGQGTEAGTLFEDENLDFIIDRDGDGIVEVGDVFVSTVEFSASESLLTSDPDVPMNTDVDDLVALVVIEVQEINETTGVWKFGESNYTVAGQTWDMVTFFTTDNSDVNYDDSDLTLTMDDAVARIIDGEQLWTFSIGDDEDTFWLFSENADLVNLLGISATDIAGIGTLNNDTIIGNVSYALEQTSGDDIFGSILLDNLSKARAGLYDGVTDDFLVDLTGNGSILGAGNYLYANGVSDIDASVNPIPEPATISLFGVALLSAAFISRRRN